MAQSPVPNSPRAMSNHHTGYADDAPERTRSFPRQNQCGITDSTPSGFGLPWHARDSLAHAAIACSTLDRADMRAAGLRYACTRAHDAAWAVGGKQKKESKGRERAIMRSERCLAKGASCPQPGMHDLPYNAHQGASSTRLIARAQSQVSRRVAFSGFCCLPFVFSSFSSGRTFGGRVRRPVLFVFCVVMRTWTDGCMEGVVCQICACVDSRRAGTRL
ncbi:hypothetical protein C8Q74DRAFT_1023362 [Fomes fomentarius]|nr:hypothetical protein C8Q74DRAFT_1023362 [Fomes fomentarius]